LKSSNYAGEIIFYSSGTKVDEREKNRLLKVMEYDISSN
jgi:hypothetical protein